MHGTAAQCAAGALKHVPLSCTLMSKRRPFCLPISALAALGPMRVHFCSQLLAHCLSAEAKHHAEIRGGESGSAGSSGVRPNTGLLRLWPLD